MLLLEAGPRDTDLWIHVPLGYGKLFARTDINWAYESEPEPALNGRRIFTPRGKVLGGSSSINGLVYIRGQPEDFDGWGIPGWGFDDPAAVLQEVGKPEPRRRRMARRGRAARGRRPPSATSCATRSSPRPRRSASRATTTSTARAQEGTGYYQATTCNGQALQHGDRLPAAGGEAAEPAGSR